MTTRPACSARRSIELEARVEGTFEICFAKWNRSANLFVFTGVHLEIGDSRLSPTNGKIVAHLHRVNQRLIHQTREKGE
jgi:hypothetical protein